MQTVSFTGGMQAARTKRKDPRAFVMVMGLVLMTLTAMAVGITQVAVHIPWRF